LEEVLKLLVPTTMRCTVVIDGVTCSGGSWTAMVGHAWMLLPSFAVAAVLTACTSAQDAGTDELRAVDVPSTWKQGAWSSGGDFDLGSSYRMWTLEYGATDQAIAEIRKTYDSALRSAGWTWHPACRTERLYLSYVKDGCWQQKGYMLTYKVAPTDGAGHHVEVKMFQDD
jgi:hypothetical protein